MGPIHQLRVSVLDASRVEDMYLEDVTCGLQFRLFLLLCRGNRDAVVYARLSSRLGKVFIKLNLKVCMESILSKAESSCIQTIIGLYTLFVSEGKMKLHEALFFSLL